MVSIKREIEFTFKRQPNLPRCRVLPPFQNKIWVFLEGVRVAEIFYATIEYIAERDQVKIDDGRVWLTKIEEII